MDVDALVSGLVAHLDKAEQMALSAQRRHDVTMHPPGGVVPFGEHEHDGDRWHASYEELWRGPHPDHLTGGQRLARFDRASYDEVRFIAMMDPTTVLGMVRATRDLLDLYVATATAVEVSAGTILAGAAKVRLGAYEKALRAVARGWGVGDE